MRPLAREFQAKQFAYTIRDREAQVVRGERDLCQREFATRDVHAHACPALYLDPEKQFARIYIAKRVNMRALLDAAYEPRAYSSQKN